MWHKTAIVTTIFLLTLAVASSQHLTEAVTSWKTFLTDFVIRKHGPILVFTFDEDDHEWSLWVEKVLRYVVKRTQIMFATLPLWKIQDGRGEKYHYNLTSLDWIRNLEKSFYLVASFRSLEDASFISEVLSDDRLFQCSVLLIAGEDMTDRVANSYFPHANQALLAKYVSDDRIDIWETYQFDVESELTFDKVGHWSLSPSPQGESSSLGYASQPLVLDDTDNVVRRQNLKGRVLRCVSLPFAPYTLYEEVDGVNQMQGWMIDVMNVIKEQCNFTYECVEPPDGEWGVFRNNKWTGMVAQVKAGNADIVVAPLDHTPGRATAIDFSFAITEIGFNMVVRRPSQADVTWSSYVMELSNESWLVTVVYLITAWFFLPLITKYAPGESDPFTFSDSFIIMVGSFGSNAHMRTVKSLSSRLMVYTVYITSFLVIIHYTAFLTSALAVTTLKLPFTTLQGMLQNGDYDFGIPAGTSLEEGLGKTKNPIYQETYNRFVKDREDELPKTFPIGIERVKEGKYVFLTGFLNFYSNYGNDCSMILLKESYMRGPTAYAFQKRSPLLRIINYHMTKQRETGVLNKLWKKWEPKGADCDNSSTKTSLGIWNVMTAHMLLGFAILTSLLCLLFERLQNKKIAKEILIG